MNSAGRISRPVSSRNLQSRAAAGRRDHRGHDRLGHQFEASVLQRGLQLLQPLDLAGGAGEGFVPRRIDDHLPRALALGHVAGAVRSGQGVLDGTALARQLDETDAGAHLEYPVLPDEPEITDLAAQVVGDLAGLVERAARQQQRELVAAETGHRVGIAHPFAQQTGDVTQQDVARQVPAGVVHRLETVQVDVAEHMRAVAAAGAGDRVVEPPLELAAIDQAGEGIMRGLIRQLPREATQFRDVMHEHRSTGDLALGAAHRRSGQFDRTLVALGTRDHDRATAQVDGHTAGQGLAHGLGDGTPVRLLDHRDHLAEALAPGGLQRRTDQPLRRGVEVLDVPGSVGGQDRLRERGQRQDSRPLGGILQLGEDPGHPVGARLRQFLRIGRFGERPHLAGLYDLDAGDEQRRLARVIDAAHVELHPADLGLETDDLNLETVGRGLFGQLLAQHAAHELREFRGNQLLQAPADQLFTLQPDQCREMPVGEHDPLPVNDDNLVRTVRQLDEQLRGDLLLR